MYGSREARGPWGTCKVGIRVLPAETQGKVTGWVQDKVVVKCSIREPYFLFKMPLDLPQWLPRSILIWFRFSRITTHCKSYQNLKAQCVSFMEQSTFFSFPAC